MLSFWILIAGVVAWRLHTAFSHFSKVPRQVPWVQKTGFFQPYLFSQIKGIWSTPETLDEAYKEYSVKGSICAIALPFSRPEILLPRNLIRWITAQSEKALSPNPIQHELIGIKYAFLNSSLQHDSAAYDVLRVQMNRQLPSLIPGIMEEIASGIDKTFGLSTEWNEVQMFVLVREVVAKATAHLIVGDTLCHNEELIRNFSKFSSSVLPSALAMPLFPPFLHPITSRLAAVVNHYYMRKALKVLGPYIEQRIIDLENDTEKRLLRQDVMTWHIEEALRKRVPRDKMADIIACRIFATLFASIESSTLTMSHALFNLCAGDDPKQVWKALEEEGRRAFSSQIDQASINHLEYADSAIKETLRLHATIKALSVQVMQPAGVRIKEHGLHLPQGSRISISAWGIHHDDTIYPNAHTFDAFRFTRQIADGDDRGTKHSMASPTEKYLSFGFGKHACPGRHFAAVETKLFLAYLAVHYDIERVHERPVFVRIGHLPIPPIKGRLRIRRKRDLSIG
ncbi:hypothetical protein F66182_6056 [Fusarium sp. NRRL 66182]|nr:hypothetical protein F66182_6056 [Fusarium sp. NRRL 66182]